MMNIELIKLLEDYFGANLPMTESTRLFHDLQIYGDDVADKLIEICQMRY